MPDTVYNWLVDYFSGHSQTIQALRILRSHGICNNALHIMYRCTVIGKLLNAVNAWCGFTSAADRQRMEALVKRGVRSGLCAADTPNLTELIESSDDALLIVFYVTKVTSYSLFFLMKEILPIISGKVTTTDLSRVV